jgi:hypothetical protein
MPLANRAKAEDEPEPAFRCAALVWMTNDAGIEQRRGFKRIFVEKIGTDKPALHQAESGMIGKGPLHFVGAGLELSKQIGVSSLEVFQDIRKLRRRVLGAQGQNTVNDMIGPGLVGGIQIARFRGRLERPHDDPRRIRPKIESLPVQELDL